MSLLRPLLFPTKAIWGIDFPNRHGEPPTVRVGEATDPNFPANFTVEDALG